MHFYQPWWQFPSVLRKISDQCYRPIINLVNELNSFSFTANINLSLLELLEKDFPDVIAGFSESVRAGKIELTGSPAQHPVLPLIPEFVQKAQIEEDENCKPNFNLYRNSEGFYLPEMAFTRNNLPLLRQHGYRWTVIDDEPFRAVHGSVPFDHIVSSDGLKLFMRSRLWSDRVSSESMSFSDFKTRLEYELPAWTGNHQAYLIIAMDAETFGHHHEYLISDFLEPMLKEWAGQFIVPIESIGKQFPIRSMSYIPDGSWSTSAGDVRINDPYPLWKSRFNVYHHWLWELVGLGLNHFDKARRDCLKMTSSCHWWWLSGRPYWEPEFMKLGAQKAVQIVRTFGSVGDINRAESLYNKLKDLH